MCRITANYAMIRTKELLQLLIDKLKSGPGSSGRWPLCSAQQWTESHDCASAADSKGLRNNEIAQVFLYMVEYNYYDYRTLYDILKESVQWKNQRYFLLISEQR